MLNELLLLHAAGTSIYAARTDDCRGVRKAVAAAIEHVSHYPIMQDISNPRHIINWAQLSTGCCQCHNPESGMPESWKLCWHARCMAITTGRAPSRAFR